MNQDAFFEQISKHYKSNLPFVVYRKPNDTVVKAMLQIDNALHIALDFSKSGFVFAPFDDKHNTIFIPVEHSHIITSDYTVTEEREMSHPQEIHAAQTKEAHLNLVQKGVDTIKATDLIKVVLSRKETVNLLDKDPLQLFKRLLNNYTTAFVYCWYHPTIGLWLGATPETLLKVEGHRFTTMALAGTQPYHGSTDVKWCDKEIEEQEIVTKAIVNNLNTSATAVHVSDVETIKAGQLLHLKTKISGVLKDDLLNAVKQIHPTPAICGFPKLMAKHFILENEDYNREFYTGFLGEINIKAKRGRNTNRRNVENNAYSAIKNTSELYVNLRCMKLVENHAEVFVGGGITKDSIPEKEWEETVNKTKTMKRVIAF